MTKKNLVFKGEKNSPVQDEKVIFDIWHGCLRMKKMKHGKAIDWTAFTPDEVAKLRVFIANV